jgi:hypothetical protein
VEKRKGFVLAAENNAELRTFCWRRPKAAVGCWLTNIPTFQRNLSYFLHIASSQQLRPFKPFFV